MGHGIYSSDLSCWERRVRKLPADHAGNTVIGEITTPQGAIVEETPVVEQTIEEEVQEVVEKVKKAKTKKIDE